MDPTSEARHTVIRRAVITLLVVTLAVLAVGSGSAPDPPTPADLADRHPPRVLDALRAAFFSTLHRTARVDRVASLRAVPAAPMTVAVPALAALAALGWLAVAALAGPRGRPRWWHGWCRRGPPVAGCA